MVTCPTCGTRNSDPASVCTACGARLGTEPPATLVSRSGELAEANAEATPDREPRPRPGPAVRVGGAPQFQGFAAALPTRPAQIKQTMLGVAPAPNAPADAARGDPPKAQVRRTMLGVAPAPNAPALPVVVERDAEAIPAEAPPLGSPPALETDPGLTLPSVGAPLAKPGVELPSLPTSLSEPPPATIKTPSNAPTLVSADAVRSPRTGSSHSRWIAIVAALLGLATVAAVFLVLRHARPVSATVILGADGVESLALDCPSCIDGTTVSRGDVTVSFVGRHATLPLRERLDIGPNKISLTLTRPGREAREIPLEVPVDFRLAPDLSELTGLTPRIRVHVAATPGAAVVIQGHPILLDAEGRALTDVEVTAELTGSSPQVVTVEKGISYTVTPGHTEPASGELLVRVPVAPLVVDSPGPSIVLEGPNFWLVGRTLAGGTASVSERPLSVSADGRFSQLMSVSAVGETTIFVRADVQGHAPRLVPLHVRRVTSLRAEAARLDPDVVHSYPALTAKSPSPRNLAVGLTGIVIEARTAGHRSQLLVDVPADCPSRPCLARVVLGASVDAKPGQTWRVYGRVREPGSVSGAIPEIAADFLLRTAEQ